MNRYIFGLVAGIGLLIAVGQAGAAQEEVSKNVTILVDYSLSTKNARQIYADALDKIFENVGMGDRVFVWKITGRSEMEPQALLDEDFVPKKGKEPKNEFYRKQAARAMKTDIKKASDTTKQLVIDAELSGKTGIIDSLQVVERVVKKNKKNRVVLVIMSDMVEDAKYNFETEKLTDAKIAQIIASQKKNELLPDLKGVQVYIVGASVPKGMSSDQFNRIRTFWLRYFKEAGADCPKENYGSALIGFKE